MGPILDLSPNYTVSKFSTFTRMICLILHILIAHNDFRVLTGNFWFYQYFNFGPNWTQKWVFRQYFNTDSTDSSYFPNYNS